MSLLVFCYPSLGFLRKKFVIILQEYRQFSLAAQYSKEPCMALVYPDGEVLFIPPVDIKVKTETKTKTMMGWGPGALYTTC